MLKSRSCCGGKWRIVLCLIVVVMVVGGVVASIEEMGRAAQKRTAGRPATAATSAKSDVSKKIVKKKSRTKLRRTPVRRASEPLSLEFRIVGGDNKPGFSVACAGGEFHYERDRGNADTTHVTVVKGLVTPEADGRLFVSFDFKVQEGNEEKNAENMIQVKGSVLLKVGGSAKLAQVGNEGSLVLKIGKVKEVKD